MKFSLGFVTTALLAIASALPSIPTSQTDIITRDDGLNGTDLEAYSLEARGGPTVLRYNCAYGEWTDRRWVEHEELRLRGVDWCSVNGKTLGSVGGQCIRVGCFKGANVWLCNDNPSFFRVKCSIISDILHQMILECKKWDGNFYSTKGQAFTSDNWNVIVTATNNC